MLGYGLTFIGRDMANRLYSAPINTEIEELKEKSLDRESTENSIYVGDNLEVLKHLKNDYQNKIKMIYIDPPYNTKNNHFIYPDNFKKEFERILQEEGIDKSEVKNQKGAIAHSGWLSFMYPRLKLARELLRDDGVIFISIDDNEQANLKLLCDEIFGEHNFISCITWNSISSVLKNTKFIRKEHEYILLYGKSDALTPFNKMPNNMAFSNPDNDPKGEWFSSNACAANQSNKTNTFAIKLPDGSECIRSWKFTQEDFENGEVNLYFKGGNVPRLKIYKSEYDANTSSSPSIFKDFGSITSAKKEIEKLFQNTQNTIFDTPKPTKLIKHLAQISTNDGDIVMDFFAGSGTTAHAVMELNAEDRNNGKQGNRKFILVQLDEAIKQDGKDKIVYDFCKGLGSENPTIADITIERVKRAGAKIREANKDSTIDTGFKVFLCK